MSTIHTQILDEAAEWFVTLRDGGSDRDAHERFTAWLCKSPEHVRAYLELTSIWAEAASPDLRRSLDAQALIARARAEGNIVAIETEPAQEAVPVSGRQSGLRRSWRQRGWLFAASVAAMFVAAALWWQADGAMNYATGIGEQRSLTLADGSRIELNARSRIRVRFSESERLVEVVEGQGLFDVAKDWSRPFIVHSADVRVRAVGTQFDVYRKASGTVVTVLEGKVEVQRVGAGASTVVDPPPADPEPQATSRASGQVLRIDTVELAAGEQAIIAVDQIARPQAPNIAAATGWTQGQLVFDSVTLAEVAQEFNRYNLRQLVIGDRQLERFLISGVFSSADPAALLRFLQEQPGFVVQETATEIRITRPE
jgi:transmembrane sensor